MTGVKADERLSEFEYLMRDLSYSKALAYLQQLATESAIKATAPASAKSEAVK